MRKIYFGEENIKNNKIYILKENKEDFYINKNKLYIQNSLQITFKNLKIMSQKKHKMN